MSGPQHSRAVREAAIEDYYATTDSVAAVAHRHGLKRSTLSGWIGNRDDGLAYAGGWYVRGGVRYPLLPERRSA